jgi:hypothetical protein
MSDTIQLNLWDWLEEAFIAAGQVPELVAVSDGVAALDSVMDAMTLESIPAQLSVAAEAFAQLSAILECKSERWLSGWDADGADGLALDDDWMAGLVRQPVSFDLSPLVEVPPLPEPSKRQRPTADSSLVGAVEPNRLLEMIEQLAQDPEFVQAQLAALAGGETPGQWREAIENCWDCCSAQVSFAHLQQQTGLAPVELWLGLLLGGYRLLPQADVGRFYQSDFQISRW